ncbi:MAG: hypothetical protein ACREIA_21265, partial [Opitutaceae bacterium]
RNRVSGPPPAAGAGVCAASMAGATRVVAEASEVRKTKSRRVMGFFMGKGKDLALMPIARKSQANVVKERKGFNRNPGQPVTAPPRFFHGLLKFHRRAALRLHPRDAVCRLAP